MACWSITLPPTLAVTTNSSNPQIYFPYISGDTLYKYELGSTSTRQVATTATSYVYDSFGNATSITTTVTDNDTNDSTYYGQWWKTVTTNTPLPNTSTWCLNLLTETQVAYTASTGAGVTRTKQFTPNLTNCRYTEIVTEPNNSTYKVTEDLGYDSFGNIDSDTVTGTGMASRTTAVTWSNSAYPTGQFPLSVTDASGATTQLSYNYDFGLRGSATDPNSSAATPIVTSWVYDPFGQKIQEKRPDGTSTSWAWTDCTTGGNCLIGNHTPLVTVTFFNKDNSVQTDGSIWYDPLERSYLSNKRMLSGAYDRNEVRYDNLGRVVKQAAPCAWSSVASACPYMTTLAYDVLNRVTSTARPISASNGTLQSTTVAYQGDTVVTTDPQGKTATKVILPNGRLGRTQDDAGYFVSFAYDAYGSLTSATDKNSLVLSSASYDYGVAPFQRSLNDADLGNRSYSYDALGDLVSWSDANHNSFSQTYDALSRPLVRTEPDLTTTWVWGSSAASHNIGKVTSIAATIAAGSYVDNYSYDSLARLADRTIAIPSDRSYSYDYNYNANSGLLDTLTYPISTGSYRLTLQYGYQNGILQKISDFNASTTVFWTANTTNPRGQITQDTLGNGVVVNRSWDSVTGWINSTQAGVGSGTTLQNNSYLFDQVGNLIQRQDNNQGLTENFQYDDLYRLKTATLNNVTNLSMTYDATGNALTTQLEGSVANTMDYQSQQSGCTYYANSQPHAQRSVTNGASGTTSYCYDANGNGVAEINAGATVGAAIWTSYNEPSTITSYTGSSSQFAYDGNHQRWVHIAKYPNGSTETTTYVGRTLERVALASGDIAYRHYIAVGNDTVVYTRLQSGSNPTYYITTDHIGSSSVVTDATGAKVVAENFAALGYRRGSSWTGAPSSSDTTAIASTTRRGFTGHEMMDNLQLVNMNGRIYSQAGQFLSPDPLVSDPGSTQSFNRYAYVRNNPLTFTDPSGYAEDDPENDDSNGDSGADPGDDSGGIGASWSQKPDDLPSSICGTLGCISFTQVCWDEMTVRPMPSSTHAFRAAPSAGLETAGSLSLATVVQVGHQSQPRSRRKRVSWKGDQPTSEVTVTAQRQYPYDPAACARFGIGCDPSVPQPQLCFGSFAFAGRERDLGGVEWVGGSELEKSRDRGLISARSTRLLSDLKVRQWRELQLLRVLSQGKLRALFLAVGKLSAGPLAGVQIGPVLGPNEFGAYFESHRGLTAGGFGVAFSICP